MAKIIPNYKTHEQLKAEIIKELPMHMQKLGPNLDSIVSALASVMFNIQESFRKDIEELKNGRMR